MNVSRINQWTPLLLLALVLVACGSPQVASEPVAEVESADTSSEETADLINAVTVEDQAISADNTVVVASVTSQTPGWMVIHTDASGSPGPIAGYAPVPAGTTSNVVVEIDTSIATSTLYAMLHIDVGVVGEYEFPGGDIPAVDESGQIVAPPFEVQLADGASSESDDSSSASVEGNAVVVENQTLGEDNTVVVASVNSLTAGWMVIHADSDGSPGPIIGYAPVPAGSSSNVTVTIDTNAATATLYAMLHLDAGVEGSYEFPGEDVPARDAAGNVVTSPFQLDIAIDY